MVKFSYPYVNVLIDILAIVLGSDNVLSLLILEFDVPCVLWYNYRIVRIVNGHVRSASEPTGEFPLLHG